MATQSLIKKLIKVATLVWLGVSSTVSTAQDILWVEETEQLKQLEKWRHQGFELGMQYLQAHQSSGWQHEFSLNKRAANQINGYKSGWLGLVDVIVAPYSSQSLWQLAQKPLKKPVITFARQNEQLLALFNQVEHYHIGTHSKQWYDSLAAWLIAEDISIVSSRKTLDSSVANEFSSRGVTTVFFSEGVNWSAEVLPKRFFALWHQNNHPAMSLNSEIIITQDQAFLVGKNHKAQLLRVANYDAWIFRNAINDWLVVNYQKMNSTLPNEYVIHGFIAAQLLVFLENQRLENSENAFSFSLPSGELYAGEKMMFNQWYLIAGTHDQSVIVEDSSNWEAIEKTNE